MVKNETGVWYKRYVSECVLCGAGKGRMERRPTPKPEDPNELVSFRQFVCGYHSVVRTARAALSLVNKKGRGV